jgi:hypothetical protein
LDRHSDVDHDADDGIDDGIDADNASDSKNGDKDANPRIRVTFKNPSHGLVEGVQRGAAAFRESNGSHVNIFFWSNDN